jgi:hypothetical protein
MTGWRMKTATWQVDKQSTVSQEHIKVMHVVRGVAKYSDTHTKLFISCDRSVGYILEHSHDLASKHTYRRVQKLRLAVVIIMLLGGSHGWQNVVITDHKTAAINAAGGHPWFHRYCSLDSYAKRVILPSTLSFLNFLMDWQRTDINTRPHSPYALNTLRAGDADLRV